MEGQDPRVTFRQPRYRSVDNDGELNMRDPYEVRALVEHRRGGDKTAAELTTVAVTGSNVVHWRTA